MRVWVKLMTDLGLQPAFLHLTLEARYSFLMLIAYAGRLDHEGVLIDKDVPLTVDDISRYTALPIPTQRKALTELWKRDFLTFDARRKVFSIKNWDRYQPPRDNTSTERQRKHRASRQRNGVTNGGANGAVTLAYTDTDGKPSGLPTEADNGKPALVAPSLPVAIPRAIPEEPSALRSLAVVFVTAFCRNDARSIDPCTDTLAIMRGRSMTVADAWEVCCKAWLAHNGKPLFGASIKTVLSHLPERRQATRNPDAEEARRRFRPAREVVRP